MQASVDHHTYDMSTYGMVWRIYVHVWYGEYNIITAPSLTPHIGRALWITADDYCIHWITEAGGRAGEVVVRMNCTLCFL